MTKNNGLPSGWEWKTLGEISTIYSGGTPPTKDDSNFNGDIPWITPADLSDHTEVYIQHGKRNISEKGLNSSSAVVIPAESVLFSSRAPIGYVAIAENDVTTNQGMKSFHLVDGVFNKYVYYYLKGNKSLVESFASGTTFLEVSKSRVSQVPIPIPPFPEQERIVAKLEETFTQLEAGVVELQNAKAQLKRYRAAVLKSAVEGDLTREWRESHQGDIEPAETLLVRILEERRKKWEEEGGKGKYKEPAAPNTDDLPELLDGWVWVNVGQIAEHRLGKMLDQAKNKGKPTPYLRNINVRWFEFDLSDLKHMRVTDDELKNVSVVKGDLVVCEGGEPGRAAVWERSGEPFAIQKALHRVRTANGVLPKYLAYRLAADAGIGALKKYFTGSTIMHFTGQSLHSYTFALPPTEEQHRIVEKIERRLSVADEIEKELDESLVRAERLRGSVLKSAFEGRLV